MTEQFHTKDSHTDAARWTDLKTRINRVLSAETEFLRKGEDWRSALPPSQVSLLQNAGPPKPVRHPTPQARPGTPLQDATYRSTNGPLPGGLPRSTSPRTTSPSQVVRVSGPQASTRYVSPVRLKPSPPPEPRGSEALRSTNTAVPVPGLRLLPRVGSVVDGSSGSGSGSGRAGPRLRLTPTRPTNSPPCKVITVTPRGLSTQTAVPASGADAADTPNRLPLSSQFRASPSSQSPTPRTPDLARAASGRRTPEVSHHAVSPTVRVISLQRKSPSATQRAVPPGSVRRPGSPVLWQRASSPHLLRNAAASTPSSGTPTVGRHTSPVATSGATPRPVVSTTRPLSPTQGVPSAARLGGDRRSTSPAVAVGPPGASRSPIVVRIVPGRTTEATKVNLIPSLRGHGNSPKQQPGTGTSSTGTTTATVSAATTTGPATAPTNANGGETSRSATPANVSKHDVRVVVRPMGKDNPKPAATGTPAGPTSPAAGLFHSWKPQPKAVAKPAAPSPPSTVRVSVAGSSALGKPVAANLSSRLRLDSTARTSPPAEAHAQGRQRSPGLRESDQGSDASSWTGNMSPSLDLLQPFADALDGVLAGVESELEQLRLANAPMLFNAALQLPWTIGPHGDSPISLSKKGLVSLGPEGNHADAMPSSPEPHLRHLLGTAAAAEKAPPTMQSPWSLSPSFTRTSANGLGIAELTTPVKPTTSSAATPASWGPKSPPPQDLVIFPPPPCPVTDPKLPGLEWENLGDVTMSDIQPRSPQGPRHPASPITLRIATVLKDGPPPQPIPAALTAKALSVDERVESWMAQHQAATTAQDVEPVPEGLECSSITCSEEASQPSSPGAPPNHGPSPKDVPLPSSSNPRHNVHAGARRVPSAETRPRDSGVPCHDFDEPSICSDDQWYKQMQQRVQAQLQSSLPLASIPNPSQPLSQLYSELLQEIHSHVARRTERVEALAGGPPSQRNSPLLRSQQPTPTNHQVHPLPTESSSQRSSGGSPCPTDPVDNGGMEIALAQAVCYSSELWSWVADLVGRTTGPWGSAVVHPPSSEQWQRLTTRARRLLYQSSSSREDLLLLAQDVSACFGITALSPTASQMLWSTWAWHCRATALLSCIHAIAHHVLGRDAHALHGAKLVEVHERLLARYSPSPAEHASLRSWLHGPSITPTANFVGVARLYQRADCLAVCRRAAPVLVEVLAGQGSILQHKARIQALKQRPLPPREDGVLGLPLPILVHAGLVELALEFVDDLHSREGGTLDAFLGNLPAAQVPAAGKGLGCDNFKAASQSGLSFLAYYYEPRDERLCAWLVAKGTVHFRYVRELKALLECVQQCEHASRVMASGTTEHQADADFDATLPRFYQALLMPFESVLLGVTGKRLVVVPHGRLWAVPFSALPDRLNNGIPLMEGWEVCLAQSCRMYLMLGLSVSSKLSSPTTATPITVVGSPDTIRSDASSNEARLLLGELQHVGPVFYIPTLSLVAPSVLEALHQAQFLHLCCPIPSGGEVGNLEEVETNCSCVRTATLGLSGPGLLATLPAVRMLLRMGVPSILAALTPMPAPIATAFAAGFYWRLVTRQASPLEAWRLTIQYLREQSVGQRVWGQFVLVGHPGDCRAS
eukprot:GGOE01018389.1.p1 GENE.GGOE01018389.1~~GGOE01018389.1.p1  ORF type:complete len:1711 (-),score=372.36 GGOE01018389.1:254-5086(-)